jgi:hypothetical protein
MIFYGSTKVPNPSFTGNLRALLPPSPSGWTRTDSPIATTPEMQKAVAELLNYDDAVFVAYTDSSARSFQVYIAYWRPGKMSPRLVAGHTPDVCWVASGWKLRARDFAYSLKLPTERELPPAQWGIYEQNLESAHVIFWHLQAGENMPYSPSRTRDWRAVISDLTSRGLNQRGEQMFIRISSKQPVESWSDWPVFRELIANLTPYLKTSQAVSNRARPVGG